MFIIAAAYGWITLAVTGGLVAFVGGYGGLGSNAVLNALRAFPEHLKNLVFVSVGVIDSGAFEGEENFDALRERTEEMLGRCLQLASGLGIPAAHRCAIGTDAVEEAERLCRRERWYQRILHSETACLSQKRLQWAGLTMVVLPAKVRQPGRTVSRRAGAITAGELR